MIDSNNIEKLVELIRYFQSFDAERNKRWVDASQKFDSYDIWIIPTIQGDVGDHLTLSYLWVLGAYEIVRSLCQRAKEDPSFFPTYRKELQNLKVEFVRIRIPLAKFEPAKKFSATDSCFAYPGFHVELGASWYLKTYGSIAARYQIRCLVYLKL